MSWIVNIICLFILVLIESIILYKLYKTLKLFVTKLHRIESISFSQDIQKGSAAIPFKIKDQFGHVIQVNAAMENSITILFISASCSTCKQLINAIKYTPELPINKNLLFISQGKVEDRYLEILTQNNISYVYSDKIVEDYNIRKVPRAVLVDKHGVILEINSINSWDDLFNMQQPDAAS
ncbi:TlpA family protein disulfide reductase [Bacillus cereus group sp. MYBK104-1]|uniref:TlpA family protein disulfide reductase n=1 Tax=unclassified Bacillus cereus group TaxID=2750818 RepID=UPI003F7B076E